MKGSNFGGAFGGGAIGDLLASNFSDEAIAVLGHRLDEARIARLVAQRGPERADALGQRLVGDRHRAPDLFVEPVLGNQAACIPDQQRQRIEIARIERHRASGTQQDALIAIDREFAEEITR